MTNQQEKQPRAYSKTTTGTETKTKSQALTPPDITRYMKISKDWERREYKDEYMAKTGKSFKDIPPEAPEYQELLADVPRRRKRRTEILKNLLYADGKDGMFTTSDVEKTFADVL